MFSYRSDKVGFFAALILIVFLAGTVLTTVILLSLGDWEAFGPWVKFVLGVGWVGIVSTVLTRVYIFAWQRKKRLAAQQPVDTESEVEAGGEGPEPAGEITQQPQGRS